MNSNQMAFELSPEAQAKLAHWVNTKLEAAWADESMESFEVEVTFSFCPLGREVTVRAGGSQPDDFVVLESERPG